jgi:hypothetical protein
MSTNKEGQEQNFVKDDPLGIFDDGKLDMEDVKTILHSRTVWVNIIAFIAFFAQSKFGYVIDESIQAQMLTVINIGLRYITSTPVKLK